MTGWLNELENELKEWLPAELYAMIRAHLSTPVKPLSNIQDWNVPGYD